MLTQYCQEEGVRGKRPLGFTGNVALAADVALMTLGCLAYLGQFWAAPGHRLVVFSKVAKNFAVSVVLPMTGLALGGVSIEAAGIDMLVVAEAVLAEGSDAGGDFATLVAMVGFLRQWGARGDRCSGEVVWSSEGHNRR